MKRKKLREILARMDELHEEVRACLERIEGKLNPVIDRLDALRAEVPSMVKMSLQTGNYENGAKRNGRSKLP